MDKQDAFFRGNRYPVGMLEVDKEQRPVRALGLLSGGLDSQLAVCLLREQGIEIEGVIFESPFFDAAAACRAARDLRIKAHRIDFTGDILKLLESPPNGFGSELNPCLDCHARMIRRAGELMTYLEFDFLFTGEVLNQRPMSQNRKALKKVADASGFAQRLLRPLSAKRLEPTDPERRGKVSREAMLDLEGRGRKRQFSLAERFGLKEVPTPAGGCRLTEPNYCRRLAELMNYEGLQDIRLIHRLRVGRHLRLPEGAKLVVGRNQQENRQLEEGASLEEVLLWTEDITGPTSLLAGPAPDKFAVTAAGITAAYANPAKEIEVMVAIRKRGKVEYLRVRPLSRAFFEEWLV